MTELDIHILKKIDGDIVELRKVDCKEVKAYREDCKRHVTHIEQEIEDLMHKKKKYLFEIETTNKLLLQEKS